MQDTKLTPQNEFSSEQWSRIDDLIAKYRGKPGALIPVLEEVQAIAGYLPEAIQRRVAAGLDLPLSRVYGVVTFYSFFTMRPRGRHQIRLCLGTACHVRGAKRNVDHLASELGITPDSCTPDGEFGLEVVRCLGACGLAPVMVIDDETHKQVKQHQIEAILGRYRDAPIESQQRGRHDQQ